MLTACRSGLVQPSSSSQSLQSAVGVAARVQAAVDRTAGYDLTVMGHNLVLPEWGGIDSGHLSIASARRELTGTVYRTGDGLYSVVYIHHMTYFRRTTCPTYSLVPGGGSLVFTTFLWSMTDAVARARDVHITGVIDNRTLLLSAFLPSLGNVVITIDRYTFLPIQLMSQVNRLSGAVTRWTFSDWGHEPSVSAPAPPIAQAGPGGNPC